MNKEKALFELYGLIEYFYEFRDMPTSDKNFDFYKELSHYCEVLEVNEEKVKEIFNLGYF